jgi:hypothetical protein
MHLGTGSWLTVIPSHPACWSLVVRELHIPSLLVVALLRVMRILCSLYLRLFFT